MLRGTSPQQIGALAAFRCGDHAATVTGTVWAVDGGWIAH
jgi:3-hydroxybutyrate dehydrogenase